MQALWARILAGEANSPGRFSKRTVDLLASLDKSDAALFSGLCGFAVELGGSHPLIYDHNHGIYTERGINFGALSHLESIGLIHFSTLQDYVRQGIGQKGFVRYFDHRIWIELPKPENNDLKLG